MAKRSLSDVPLHSLSPNLFLSSALIVLHVPLPIHG